MAENTAGWDVEADVVVLGSGAAGLVAALAAHEYGAGEVVVVEKSGMVGGTSAMSGGMMWIPMNHHAVEDGIEDSIDDVVAYLDALAPGLLDPDTLSAYLECGPEMIRFMADHTPAKLRHFRGFPDYQPSIIGAKPHGGRSLDNDVFPFEELGSAATRVNPPKTGVPKLLSRFEDKYGGVSAEELEDRQRRDCRGQGQALVGALFKGILDRNIPVLYETRARHLVKDDGRVVGLTAEQDQRVGVPVVCHVPSFPSAACLRERPNVEASPDRACTEWRTRVCARHPGVKPVRSLLLLFLGVPLPIILLLAMCTHHF